MTSLNSTSRRAAKISATEESLQQSLEAASPQAVSLLRLLSTFTGWATLDSAEGIAGITSGNSKNGGSAPASDVPIGYSFWMAELIEAKLVEVKDPRSDALTLLSEPDLYRVYDGARTLSCLATTLDQHSAPSDNELLSAHNHWFITRVEALGAGLRTRHEPYAQMWLDLELPEYLAAIDRLIEDDPLRALRAANRLGDFWVSHGQTRSGARLLSKALRALGQEIDEFIDGPIDIVRGRSLLAHMQLRAENLKTLSEYRRWLGVQAGTSLADSTLSHRDRFAIALHLVFAAMVARDYETSILTAEQGRDLAMEIGDDFHAANFNFYLSRVTEQAGDNKSATVHIDRAVEHARRTNNESFLASCLSQRTVLLKKEFGPAKVVESLRPIVETHLRHRMVKDAALISVPLALAQFQIGQRLNALQTLRRALSLSNRIRYFDGELTCVVLITFSDLSAESTPENIERCAKLYGGVRAHLARFHATISPDYAALVDGAIEGLRQMLGGAQFEKIVATGSNSWAEVIAQADAFAADQLETLKEPVEPAEANRNTPTEQIELGTAELSGREHEVLALLLQGKSDKRIAEKLGLKPNTVRSYNSRIFRKFDVSSRSELLALHSASH